MDLVLFLKPKQHLLLKLIPLQLLTHYILKVLQLMDGFLENYHCVDNQNKLESLIFLQVFLFLQLHHRLQLLHQIK